MARSKKNKALRALRPVVIGEAFIFLGILGEFGILLPSLTFFGILAMIGIIFILVGMIRLCRINVYFLIDTICISFSFLCAIVAIILQSTLTRQDQASILTSYNTFLSILSKVVSLVFTGCFIRGCSKEATGKATSRFSWTIVIENFICKASGIVLNIVSGFYIDSNPNVYKNLTIIATVMSVLGETFFIIYLYRTYFKVKRLVNKTAEQ